MSGATPPRASARRESTMRTRTRPLPSMYGMSVKSIVPRQSAAIWHLSPIATPSAPDPGTASRRRAPTECTMGGPELEIPARAFAVRRRGKLGGKRLAQRLDRHAHGNLDLRAERGRRAARRRERGHGAGLCALSLIFASSHELAIGTPAQMRPPVSSTRGEIEQAVAAPARHRPLRQDGAQVMAIARAPLSSSLKSIPGKSCSVRVRRLSISARRRVAGRRWPRRR